MPDGYCLRMEQTDLSQARIGENESTFRKANEKIELTADAMQIPWQVPFICECPDETCMEIVRLTLDEYEDVRQHPRRFFAAPGHAATAVGAGAAVLVADCGGYTLADKIGIAGEIAEARYDELAAHEDA